jgi:3-oxoisoapionate kinase
MEPKSENLLFTFYGDDFTGSTDALEALSLHGIPTVLFLGLPDPARVAEFRDCRAIGVAGESRSKSPEWMSTHLPAVFKYLKQLGAPVCQYKVCSTFDSSPTVGNIGRALEIGQDIFKGSYVPIVASAPRLGRWVVFANLFAAAENRVYRIDHHPTMSRHPVTPMTDGDLRVHLSKQTSRPIASLDILSLDADGGRGKLVELLRDQPGGILFDALSDSHLQNISELVWSDRVPFVVASSGFTFGLAAHLSKRIAFNRTAQPETATEADRLVVMSGSGSPATERQIRWALANGFAGIRLDAVALVDPSQADRTRNVMLSESLRFLQGGSNIVIYSALGPSDCNGTSLRDDLGKQMGILLREILLQSGAKRAVIAGGDTSSHAGQQLGIYALTMVSDLTPGAPLCRAHSDEKAFSGLELVMKGGQMGREDFFGSVLRGRL